MKIALLGNPNTGKSSVFNLLTGLRQHVGNFPGVTVEKKTGTLKINDEHHKVIDFPVHTVFTRILKMNGLCMRYCRIRHTRIIRMFAWLYWMRPICAGICFCFRRFMIWDYR